MAKYTTESAQSLSNLFKQEASRRAEHEQMLEDIKTLLLWRRIVQLKPPIPQHDLEVKLNEIAARYKEEGT